MRNIGVILAGAAQLALAAAAVLTTGTLAQSPSPGSSAAPNAVASPSSPSPAEPFMPDLQWTGQMPGGTWELVGYDDGRRHRLNVARVPVGYHFRLDLRGMAYGSGCSGTWQATVIHEHIAQMRFGTPMSTTLGSCATDPGQALERRVMDLVPRVRQVYFVPSLGIGEGEELALMDRHGRIALLYDWTDPPILDGTYAVTSLETADGRPVPIPTGTTIGFTAGRVATTVGCASGGGTVTQVGIGVRIAPGPLSPVPCGSTEAVTSFRDALIDAASVRWADGQVVIDDRPGAVGTDGITRAGRPRLSLFPRDSPVTHQLTGSVEEPSYSPMVKHQCYGRKPRLAGVQAVIVTDGARRLVGHGSTGLGTPVPHPGRVGCRFAATVSVADAPAYHVRIGPVDLGTRTRAWWAAHDWTLAAGPHA